MENKQARQGMAYCIPTYNHPEVIRDVLGKCISLYQQYNIDVYIYDSSTDNQTGEVVKTYVEWGGSNLYYVKVDSSVSIDDKMLMIFSGYGLQKEYKYIWPVKDRVCFGERTLKIVMEAMDKDYDAIFLALTLHPLFEEEGLSAPESYDDPAEFYGSWGWLATSMDVAIFHAQTLLKGMDWERFKERYFFDGENCFDHFTVLFHGIAQKEKCSVRIVSHENIEFYSSPLASSTWAAQIFHIWAGIWAKVNNALPSCYDKYKNKTVKRATTLPWIFGSYDQMIKLKEDGILTEHIYEQIYAQWENLSDISREELAMIVCGQYGEIHRLAESRVRELFRSGNYAEACSLYRTNRWVISNFGCSREVVLMGDFLEIYRAERFAGVKKGIFYGISGYKDVEQKYLALRDLFHRMECGSDKESCKEAAGFIRKNGISSQFINYLIDKTCTEKEKVLCRLLEGLQG